MQINQRSVLKSAKSPNKKATAFIMTLFLFLATAIITPGTTVLAEDQKSTHYDPGKIRSPISTFAALFIEACQGEQWLLDETESLLNTKQSSIDYLSFDLLDQITALSIKDRKIEGKIPKAIGYFKNLEYIFFSGNHLRGEFPGEFFTLSRLKNIDISDNDYEGSIPEDFNRLPNLEILRLSENAYTGKIPDSIAKINTLILLDVSANKLTGGISPMLGELKNLNYLDVSGNNLEGNIPEELLKLENLEVFLAWNCGLSGSIPTDIGRLKNLKYLDLAENKLSGAIPMDIERLENMRELCLSYNRLEETIPDAFSRMKNLTDVHIDHNKLRGHIPDSLYESHKKGAKVSYSQNYLTGEKALEIGRSGESGISSGNFIDSSDAQQYKLTGPDYIYLEKIGEEGALDLYPRLKNTVAIGNTALPKPMLPAASYEVYVTPPGFSELIKAEVTKGGIFIYSLGKLPYASEAAVSIRIKDNTSSDYSAYSIRIGTEQTSEASKITNTGSRNSGYKIEDTKTPLAQMHIAYIRGYEDYSVRPDKKLSREEAAAVIYRISGEADVENTVIRSSFEDVKTDRWSAAYIDFARKNKLMTGYEDGSFRPEAELSRNEFAVLLCNLEDREVIKAKVTDSALKLTDVPENWAAPYVRAAYKAGFIKGYEDGTFRGTNSETRGEAVSMLNRILDRKAIEANWEDVKNPYNDLKKEHWAYYEMMEASIVHTAH